MRGDPGRIEDNLAKSSSGYVAKESKREKDASTSRDCNIVELIPPGDSIFGAKSATFWKFLGDNLLFQSDRLSKKT